MLNRCYNKNKEHYKYYGARGIKVCDEWKNSFENFIKWAENNGYADNLTIDRIDVNGNYCPENCRWITIKEQANNKRNNRFITYNGKTQTIAQWSKETGISEGVIRYRYITGWDIQSVFKSVRKSI